MLGVAIAAPSVARARLVGAGLRNAEVTCADAATHPLAPAGFDLAFSRLPPAAVQAAGRSALSEMRHNLFSEHFHIVDLAVEVAGFRAEPEP